MFGADEADALPVKNADDLKRWKQQYTKPAHTLEMCAGFEMFYDALLSARSVWKKVEGSIARETPGSLSKASSGLSKMQRLMRKGSVKP